MFRIKYSREVILKLLFQIDMMGLNGKKIEEILEENDNFFTNINEKEKEFITGVIDKVLDQKEKIDEIIAKNLIGWKLERLLSVDRSLLRMGIAEAQSSTQKAVIIDDIIRIAKKYGSEESYKIINAILDKVIS
ncbi:MAG: transcription antitermination factor NusB [Candidatus Aminicenantes bacterium]|nr:transcription antitermination factor NusB [Candidatus Aminicenantes bacterium]